MISNNKNTKNSNVVLKIYNVLGREVAILVNKFQKAGTYEAQFSINQFSNNQLPSGIYFYQLSIDNVKFATKKMIYAHDSKLIRLKNSLTISFI